VDPALVLGALGLFTLTLGPLGALARAGGVLTLTLGVLTLTAGALGLPVTAGALAVTLTAGALALALTPGVPAVTVTAGVLAVTVTAGVLTVTLTGGTLTDLLLTTGDAGASGVAGSAAVVTAATAFVAAATVALAAATADADEALEGSAPSATAMDGAVHRAPTEMAVAAASRVTDLVLSLNSSRYRRFVQKCLLYLPLMSKPTHT